ncbi:MAG: helix-turn-helix transcriptional regulator [Gemmobacter sp.]|nr:helix-turn-helix transcriptional regulator [Gemmobacter sp.]
MGKDHPDGSDRPHHAGSWHRPAPRAQGAEPDAGTARRSGGAWQRTVSNIETGTSGAKLDTIFDLLAALDLEIRIVPRSRMTPADIEDIF